MPDKLTPEKTGTSNAVKVSNRIGTHKNYAGQTINGFTFVKTVGKTKKGNYIWEIKCHCGVVFNFASTNIIRGTKKSCGCLHNRTAEKNPTFKDYTGQIINHFKILNVVEKRGKDYVWNIECFCGKTFLSKVWSIKSGNKYSCGCAKRPTQWNAIVDLNGCIFYSLKVIDIAYISMNNEAYWICECKCGKVVIKSSKYLQNNGCSCGCSFIDKSNQWINNWYITDKYEYRNHKIFWLCRCKCQTEKYFSTHYINERMSISCGCLYKLTIDQKKQKQQENWMKKKNNETEEARQKRLIAGRQWYYENKQRILKEREEKYANNIDGFADQLKIKMKQYFKTPKGKAARKKQDARLDIRIKRRLSNRIRSSLNSQYIKKTNRTHELVGCSISYLKIHLENQFTTGMSWDNYGDWHIDHIRPCCSFDLTDPEQQKQCFHYTNLQPLWWLDNIKKGGKWNDAQLVDANDHLNIVF